MFNVPATLPNSGIQTRTDLVPPGVGHRPTGSRPPVRPRARWPWLVLPLLAAMALVTFLVVRPWRVPPPRVEEEAGTGTETEAETEAETETETEAETGTGTGTEAVTAIPEPATPPPAAEPGTLSVSTTPWSQIYVDGVLVKSDRWLRKHPVDGGVHEVRLVCSALDNQEKVFRVRVDGTDMSLGCWDFAAAAPCSRGD